MRNLLFRYRVNQAVRSRHHLRVLVSNDLVMLLPITDLALRSVWLSLSVSNRIFLLYFCGVSIYTLSLSLYGLFHLHSLNKQPANENASPAPSFIDILNRRLANLRQLHLFTLYLFGFCLAVNIPNAFVINGLYKTWPIGGFIHALTFLLSFDAAIFLGFLLLHSLQWVVSARVDSLVRQHR